MKKPLAQLPKKLMRRGRIGSAIFFQKLFVFVNQSIVSQRYLEFLKQVRKIRLATRRSKCALDYKIIVINRKNDKGRLKFFKNNLNRLNLPFERYEAADAHDPNFDFGKYSDLIGSTFFGKDMFPRGTLGCFISHYTAWLQFLDSGDSIRFFCEDDALILWTLPQSAENFQLPSDADVVFLNQRMGERLSWEHPLLDSLKYIPLNKVLANKYHKGDYFGAPGLDGYLLTKNGADKLTKKIQQEKFTIDIDWYVLFAALTEEERLSFIKNEGSGRFDWYQNSSSVKLNAYVALPIAVEQVEFHTTIKRPDAAAQIKRSSF